MAAAHPNSFKARKTLKVGSRSYTYFSLKAVEKQVGDLSRLPFSLRVLLENLVRHEDGTTVKKTENYIQAGDSFSFTPAAGTNTYTLQYDADMNQVGEHYITIS